MSPTLTLALAAATAYTAASLLLVSRLAGPHPEAPDGRLAASGLAAIALHAVLLWRATHTPAGIGIGLMEAASLATWGVVVLYLVPLVNRAVRAAGLLVLPLAALAALAPLAGAGAGPPHALSGFGVRFHAAVSILAYSVLALAACQALLLAFQERRLRARRPRAALVLLPPLDTQERWLFGLVGAGFGLLGLGLASGLVFVDDMLAQHLAHKTVITIAAWVLFGVLLWGRWQLGWRGRTAVRWCLAGFATLAVGYFGSRTVLEVLLGRPWSGG